MHPTRAHSIVFYSRNKAIPAGEPAELELVLVIDHLSLSEREDLDKNPCVTKA
jgi:hypothetical protein